MLLILLQEEERRQLDADDDSGQLEANLFVIIEASISFINLSTKGMTKIDI